MRDPKQKKEALSQFGIKEEELGQAITETGKMKEMTEYKVMPKVKKAQDAMKLAQMKIQAARAKQATNKQTFMNEGYKVWQQKNPKGTPLDFKRQWEAKDPRVLAAIEASRMPTPTMKQDAYDFLLPKLSGENKSGDIGSDIDKIIKNARE